MLLFRVASAAAAPSSSTTTIPHLPVRYEPLISLEHVNINAGGTWTEQLSRFWFSVMGGADDPRGAVVCSQVQAAGGPMQGLHWANFGLQQFHLPVGEPEDSVQVVRGEVGLAYTTEELAALQRRLEDASATHAVGADGSLRITCPVGNRLRAVEWAGAETWFGPKLLLDPREERPLPGGPSRGLGIQYVRFDVPEGAAAGICRFYLRLFGATAEVGREGRRPVCVVRLGHHQSLQFAEALPGEPPVRRYDGHHVALYTNDFAAVYERSREAGLVWNNPRFPHLRYDSLAHALRHSEFRLKDLTDPDTGELLYTLEHEVRSVMHPGFSCRHWIAAEGEAAKEMVGDYPTTPASPAFPDREEL